MRELFGQADRYAELILIRESQFGQLPIGQMDIVEYAVLLGPKFFAGVFDRAFRNFDVSQCRHQHFPRNVTYCWKSSVTHVVGRRISAQHFICDGIPFGCVATQVQPIWLRSQLDGGHAFIVDLIRELFRQNKERDVLSVDVIISPE
jgi:hypothetical protein